MMILVVFSVSSCLSSEFLPGAPVRIGFVNLCIQSPGLF